MPSPDRLRIMLVQANPVAGDIAGNLARAREALAAGAAGGADLVVLPEMFLSGYQVLDLSVRPAFLRDVRAVLEALAGETRVGGPALGIGAPVAAAGRDPEQDHAGAFNAYHLLQDGRVRASFRKHHRPNYGVFDEKRLYVEGEISGPVEIAGCRVAFPICEDMWFGDVAEGMEESGAELFVIPNGSPYDRGKYEVRVQHMVARTVETELPLVYLNMVGGQDDQVFDGGSFAMNPGGGLMLQMPFFAETTATVELSHEEPGWRIMRAGLTPVPDPVELDYHAMVVATRDYVRKSGFGQMLLGLSGGVDSALVATVATDALGPENVRCVVLPSRYTSAISLEDAAAVTSALGARLDEIAIGGAVEAVTAGLAPLFAGRAPGIAEENVQSRLRAVYLMALSNKFGELLLTTGNKSEMAVGYATLYGDMCGAYNPLKDLYKTRVYEACRWRNGNHRVWMKGPGGHLIPTRVIEKAPTAELRENQRDEDSLPPYPVLDAILERLVEDEASVEEIVADGYDRETVTKVQGLLYVSEYKRFQAPPGVKLTKKAFWLDRRYSVVNRWRDRS